MKKKRDLDVGNAVGLVALDLSKVFNMIDHNILINKLINLNFGYKTISFLKNYLSNRTMIVRTTADVSSVYNLTKGVPQGSILGPLLFSLYVNDLPSVVESCRVVQYADDTTIFASSKYPCNIQACLDKDLRNLVKWFTDNGLKVNPQKTEFVLFANSRSRGRFDHIKIAVNGSKIEEKEHINILGVTLTNNLSWDIHTRNVTNNLKFYYRSYSRSCRMLTTDTRRLLYNAAIASRMGYCDAVWDCCSVRARNRLQTIQNRCARRILDQLPGTSSAPLLRRLGWIRLEHKRKLHKCVLLHKIINGRGPGAMTEMLSSLRPEDRSVCTRGVSNECLYIPRFNTDYVKKSFFVDTAKAWNSIPMDIRNIKNSLTFKEKLQNHYLKEDDRGRLSV